MTFAPSTDIRRKAWQKVHPDGSAEDMEAALEDSPLAKDEYSALAFTFCGTTTSRGAARARARDGSEAARDRKVNGFQIKTFRKASILSAGPGQEGPGIEKPSIFN